MGSSNSWANPAPTQAQFLYRRVGTDVYMDTTGKVRYAGNKPPAGYVVAQKFVMANKNPNVPSQTIEAYVRREVLKSLIVAPPPANI